MIAHPSTVADRHAPGQPLSALLKTEQSVTVSQQGKSCVHL